MNYDITETDKKISNARIFDIAKEYLESRKQHKLYNPDYIIQELLVQFNGYQPIKTQPIYSVDSIFSYVLDKRKSWISILLVMAMIFGKC